MNAGFSSLALLKAQLLNEALVEQNTYDALILAVGLGMAGKLESFCNRKFARVVCDKFTVSGGRQSLVLPRYPVEEVSLVESWLPLSTAWTIEANAVDWYRAESGLVSLAAVYGGERGQIRVTYTGGAWWDTTEDATGVAPAGAALLPDAIRSAWFLQCEHVWRHRDKLGVSVAQTDDGAQGQGLGAVDLIPIVKSMLSDEVRYSMT